MSGVALVDSQGAAVVLGKELGRGGEGAVSDIRGRPGSVAKVYLKPPDAELSAKLAAMAAMADQQLTALAAWPTLLIHGSKGAVIGFVMPKVEGHRPVFQLYGPKLRLREFPKADWRFLIHAAANTARAFAAIHSRGLVVGDVNHGNLVVAEDARVRLIDCDSFQVVTGGRRWLCGVGVGTHQPPEMQGVSDYRTVVRTPNHDAFGLAVLVFQLLCMGRHPFAGRNVGGGEQPTIEDAIAACRYAFSTDRKRTQMVPPPGSLPMEALTPAVRDLFEAAFTPTATKAGRPDAERWIATLHELSISLRPCEVNPHHHHLPGLGRCPWCEIEAASGAPLFPAVFVRAEGNASGMLALWQQVLAVTPPPPLPPLPDPLFSRVAPAPEITRWLRRRRRERVAVVVVAALLATAAFTLVPLKDVVFSLLVIGAVALAAYIRPRGQLPKKIRRELLATEVTWQQIRSAWSEPSPQPTFEELRRSLDATKAKHDGLGQVRAARMGALHERRMQSQMADHLNAFYVASARIPGVGRAKLATLQANGVDTALDVEEARILAIPGFGPATTRKLCDWRRTCERLFKFDPRRGVSQADVNAVERDIAAMSSKLVEEMAAGLSRLKAIGAAATARRQLLEGKAAEVAPRLAHATANAKALGLKL